MYPPHLINVGLIAKLEQIQVEGSCLLLFKSYLANRKQIVVVDGQKSSVRDLHAGIPQGSRLVIFSGFYM